MEKRRKLSLLQARPVNGFSANYSLFHCGKDETNVSRVCCLRQVGVDAQLGSVGLRESPKDVFRCLVDVCPARVLFKVI